MTRNEALKAIINKAAEMGLKSGEHCGSTWVSVTGKVGYTHITITEKIDRDRSDYANGIFAGHFEVSAEISRMGGEPSADELIEAADQIRLAAEFVKACEGIDLSFREDSEGKAA